MTDLIATYDCLLSDLDGVVYTGDHAVPDAVEGLNRVTESGMPVGYVTNNASRSPQTVAEQLVQLGLKAAPEQVFGSAWAGLRLLADTVDHGVTVLVVGSDYLAQLVKDHGFVAVRQHQDGVAAVIQGFSKDLRWEDLAQASFAIENGATWVATNTDATLPVAEGVAPGNGSMVDAVSNATGAKPVVAGKPEPTLFRLAAQSLGGSQPLVLGDRLDTDILGGNRAEMDTALVLTGINSAADALCAPPDQRPTHLLATVADLHRPVPPVTAENDHNRFRCGSAWAQVEHSTVLVSAPIKEDVAAARAACAAWWSVHPNEAAAPGSVTPE